MWFCTKKLYENSNVFQSSRITWKVKQKSYQYNLNPLITEIIKKLRLPNFIFEQFIYPLLHPIELDQWYGNFLWFTDLMCNNFVLCSLRRILRVKRLIADDWFYNHQFTKNTLQISSLGKSHIGLNQQKESNKMCQMEYENVK